MNRKIQAFAANEPKGKFQPFEFDPGELRPEQVEIRVTYAGICHSDLSMRDNEWGNTVYPFVGGHESVGEIVALGENTKGLKIGDKVGLGWNSGSCMHCYQCMSGYHINCAELEQTIVARYGGFADRVRCNWEWAIKLPKGVSEAEAGPLFCGGITVFNPFVQLGIKPTDKVGIVGIGGLGHLAVQFADKWGCEVTAFTSSASKADEAAKMGADYIVDTHSAEELAAVAGKFDMIMTTANASLNWQAYFKALAPKGNLHVVGAVLEPIPVLSFNLIAGQKSVSGTATGSPAVVSTMLDFCARHQIEAVTEHFPMSRINDAFDRLEAGNARYRLVLDGGK
jgi:alcohol/geraniol dehydrogenase (NADP+)